MTHGRRVLFGIELTEVPRSCRQLSGAVINDERQERLPRLRQTIFIVAVLLVLAALQTPVLVLVLANFMSQPEAEQLTSTVRSATPGVLVALVVTYFYERAKDSVYRRDEERLAERISVAIGEVVRQDDARRLANYLEVAPPAEALETVINRLYTGQTRLSTLSQTLLPGRQIYDEVDVEWKIRNSNSRDTYILDSTYRAAVRNLPELLVAFVEASDTAFWLTVTCPRLNLITVYTSQDSAESVAARATSSQSAVQFWVEKDGRPGAVQSGSFERVLAADYSTYGVPVVDSENRQILLLRLTIPNGADNKVMFMIQSSGTQDRTTNFLFHAEDRLSFVRRISLDWSGFTMSQGEPFEPRLVPFFPPLDRLAPIEPGSTRVDVVIGQWLLPGQGLMMVW